MASLEEMKVAVISGATKVLTIERAKALKGKRIATIFFDFHQQHLHEVDEFVVGDLKSEFDLLPDKKSVIKQLKDRPHMIRKMKSTFEITTGDDRRTFLKACAYNSGIFTGPDIDFEVWFKEV
jgi:hypothetical protein